MLNFQFIFSAQHCGRRRKESLIKFEPAIVLILLSTLLLCHATAEPQSSQPKAHDSISRAVRAEQLRAVCLANRRCVCGRVLKVFPNGLLVDSGYTTLFRSALHGEWHLPATVVASRDPHLVEGQEPDSVCVGPVFLTDLPRRLHSKKMPKIKQYDYVVLHSYPAGQFTYSSLGNTHTVRRFAGGLETAVNLIIEDERASHVHSTH